VCLLVPSMTSLRSHCGRQFKNKMTATLDHSTRETIRTKRIAVNHGHKLMLQLLKCTCLFRRSRPWWLAPEHMGSLPGLHIGSFA